MRFLRNSALLLIAALTVLIAVGLEPVDDALYPPKPGEEVVSIWVADHGWHSSLVINVGDLVIAADTIAGGAPDEAAKLIALARAMRAAEWIEVGWGDEGFYRADAAGPLDVSPGVIARALFLPTTTVAHVFPGLGSPPEAFPASDLVKIDLSRAGFARLGRRLAASFSGTTSIRDIGPGIYGYARFFEATGEYSALKTCNSWVSELLRAGGLASSGVLSGFSAVMMRELRMRNDGVF